MCNHEALACRVDLECNMYVFERSLRRGGTNDQSVFLRLDGIQYLLPECLRCARKACGIVVAFFHQRSAERYVQRQRKPGSNEHRLSGEMHSEQQRGLRFRFCFKFPVTPPHKNTPFSTNQRANRSHAHFGRMYCLPVPQRATYRLFLYRHGEVY
jgi:hypothetical protein